MMIQTICISGASSGIGRATAELFAKRGYRVAIGARRDDRLADLKTRLLDTGATAVFAGHLDVTVATSVRAFCDKAVEALGPVNILVNNAGGALGLDRVVDGDEDDWRTMFHSNVLGLLSMTKTLLPAMIARRAGQIINIGSIAGHQVYEGGAAYCAAKHAVGAITEALKLEVNGTGVRVCTIDPGLVQTEFSEVRFKGDQQRADQVYQGLTPLTAHDVAECIEFVVSRPAHVNIDSLLLTPTDQATVYKVHRRPSREC